MNDRDRRDRGPLRGVAKGDRGGIRRDRFQPKFTARDRDTHKKPTSSRDSFKSKTDKGTVVFFLAQIFFTKLLFYSRYEY